MILAYNEPNLTDQANMTPTRASELWPNLVAVAEKLGMRLTSPAMNYGTLAGYSDPEVWLDEFYSKPGVSLDDVENGIGSRAHRGRQAHRTPDADQGPRQLQLVLLPLGALKYYRPLRRQIACGREPCR